MRLIVDWTVGEYEFRTYVEPYEFESKEAFRLLVEEKKELWEQQRIREREIWDEFDKKSRRGVSLDDYRIKQHQLDALDAVIIIDDRGREFWLDNMRDPSGWVELNVFTVDEWFEE